MGLFKLFFNIQLSMPIVGRLITLLRQLVQLARKRWPALVWVGTTLIKEGIQLAKKHSA